MFLFASGPWLGRTLVPKGCPRGKRKGLRASFALSGDLKGTPGSGDSKGSRGKAQGAKVLEIPLGSSKRAKECEEARVALASRAQEELLFPPILVAIICTVCGMSSSDFAIVCFISLPPLSHFSLHCRIALRFCSFLLFRFRFC